MKAATLAGTITSKTSRGSTIEAVRLPTLTRSMAMTLRFLPRVTVRNCSRSHVATPSRKKRVDVKRRPDRKACDVRQSAVYTLEP